MNMRVTLSIEELKTEIADYISQKTGIPSSQMAIETVSDSNTEEELEEIWVHFDHRSEKPVEGAA